MAKLTTMLTLVVWLASLGAVQAQSMAKPLGKWERKIGKSHVTMIVEENRLHAIVIGEKPCILHADYGMTKDGVIYGVVTSIECDDEDDDFVRASFDAPFSCRFRIDEGSLNIRDLKFHEGNSKEDVWNGRFKPVALPPIHTTALLPSPATAGRLVPQPVPSGQVVHPVVGIPTNEQTHPLMTTEYMR
jgi:hypothetical protein